MKLNKSKIVLGCLLLSILMTGCLKDKEYDNGSIQSVRNSVGDQKVVEIALTTTSTVNFLQISLNATPNDTTFNLIPVTLASVNGAPEDINVTLVPNPALIGNYNANNGTIHELAPINLYSITNPASSDGTGYVVTIPKGSNTGYLKIKIKPTNFLGVDYALGFQISKIDPSGYLISGNLREGIVAIGIKNKYDGEYILSGTFNDVLAPANNPTGPGDPYPYHMYLITASANSNVMYIPAGGFFHLIAGGAVYGEFDPIFTFDASDKIVAVTNYYGQPSATRFRSGAIDPTGAALNQNQLNPDKSIDAKYILLQSGVLKANFLEHLQYVGPRP
jgi:Domain of unknown function (DUF1735)